MALREISGPGSAELPKFVDSYYEQLKADYEFANISLQPPLVVPATWEDLYRLEMATLRARTEPDLRRSAWVVRLRFRNVAGESGYQTYLASSPPDPATAGVELLLADLVNLLRRTYYLIALAPASEAIRHALLLGAVAIGAVAIATVLAIVFVVQPQNVGIFQIVLLAGAIGGTMSLIQRVQSLPEADPLLFRLSGRTTILQSLLIPPLTGAIFAAVLFMIFAAGVLSGDLFPAFAVAAPTAKGTDFSTFFYNTTPNGGKSYALVIVWSFIAGFAERFVPDTIDRLTA
ncbi:MAG: hypothetical protein ABR591_15195, partial [Candidatus Velthaea sp.]